ncbi:MAG TPA: hypothetical protein VH591_12160 [Ktedonobacterales bacterium]|jgi:hypothetical protein
MTTIEPQPVLPGPDCATIAPLLPLLDSSDLSAEEAIRARAHLETCAWCKREHAVHAIVDAALRRQYGEPPERALPFLTMESFVNTPDTRDRPGQLDTTYLHSPSDTARTVPNYPRRGRGPGRLTGIAAVAAALLLVGLATTLFAVISQGAHGPAQNSAPTATAIAHQPLAPLHLPAGTTLLGLSMASPTDGWAVGVTADGQRILLLRYHDGQWAIWPGTLPQLQLSLSADSLSMDSPTDGWMTGEGGMLHYTNGQWVAVAVPGVGGIDKVQMVSPTDGWATAFIQSADKQSGVFGMLRYTGGAWSVVPLPPSLREISDETQLDFSVTTSGECWLLYRVASSNSTEILRYTGDSFQVAYTLPHVQEYHITMGASENGWLTGINANNTPFYHFDGSAWTKVAIPAGFTGPSSSNYAAVISPSGVAWLFGIGDSGHNGAVARYLNGSWEAVTAPSTIFPSTFRLVADDEGWAIGAVGDRSVLYHYQNGRWTPYPN